MHIETRTVTTSSAESFNNVFSSTYQNYLIVGEVSHSTTALLNFRLRVGGTDATGSNYLYQYLRANQTSVSANFNTVTAGEITPASAASHRAYFSVNFYSPFLAAPTGSVSSSHQSLASPWIAIEGVQHTLSTSYDGITIYPSAGNITGLISIYGLRK